MFITANVEKSAVFLDAFEGFICVRNSKADKYPLYTVSTKIHRQTTTDALSDAIKLKESME